MAIRLDIIKCRTARPCQLPLHLLASWGSRSPRVTAPRGCAGTGLHCCKLQLINMSPAPSPSFPTSDSNDQWGCLCCSQSLAITIILPLHKCSCYLISWARGSSVLFTSFFFSAAKWWKQPPQGYTANWWQSQRNKVGFHNCCPYCLLAFFCFPAFSRISGSLPAVNLQVCDYWKGQARLISRMVLVVCFVFVWHENRTRALQLKRYVIYSIHMHHGTFYLSVICVECIFLYYIYNS